MTEASVFDTRYFNQAYYTTSQRERAWLSEVFVGTRRRVVSVVTVHEVYRLALRQERREVARLRSSVMERDFEVMPLDTELAVSSAELRHSLGLSLADGAIAATALREDCPVVTDNPHFGEVRGLRLRWFR